MVTRPTVLVLGAGASKPYKFPSGPDLFHGVCNALSTMNSPQFAVLHNELGFGKGNIIDFTTCLRTSGRSSVDAFLENREDFMELGKLAMAAYLIPLEEEANLFASNVENENWYKYLFSKMVAHFDGLGDSVGEFGDNKISFITFNYDRSLEHFLHTSIKKSYGISDELAGKSMERIRILHVHGNLADLPWVVGPKRKLRPYDTQLDGEHVTAAAENIKIISESKDDSPEFDEARALMSQAEWVVFVGFGYHPTNLKRLDATSLQDSKIHGTTYRLTALERNNIQAKLGSSVVLDRHGYGILPFFRNSFALERQGELD